jgi:hypothetical protein
MGRFDGVVLLDAGAADPTLIGVPATPALQALQALVAARGGHGTVARRAGVPGMVQDVGGRRIVTVGLRAGTGGQSGVIHAGEPDHAPARDPAPERDRVTRIDDTAIGILSPAPTVGLIGCRPLAGGRIHVALFGQAMTVCGRLPVSGALVDPGRVDCLRCRRSDELGRRFAAQLAGHDRLLEVVDPLTAAALAGWWPRLDHRDPGDLPLLLDAMAGARLHALPGAPTTDQVLRQVRRHRSVASDAVRDWAAGQARPRLEQQLRRLLLDAGGDRVSAVRRELALAGALLEPADLAETLVTLLERHGPVPSLEPLVLDIARRAGDAASDRVQRWRRLHGVAAALQPGRHPRPTRPITHDRLHAHQQSDHHAPDHTPGPSSGRVRTGSHP